MNRSCPSSLALADGVRWLIRAGDPEAARVVAALSAAMQLQSPPCCHSDGATGGRRELLVTVGQGKTPPANLSGPGSALSILPPPTDDDMLAIGMSKVALTIAQEAHSRGGVLLHGALAEAPIAPPPAGRGVLLAGPGTVGKTTASNRLPPPWRSLCDDATLVVRDAAGRYWAHPWPTWSRFYTLNGVPGPGGSWDVQRAVSLRAVFFLSQSQEDRAEPVGVSQATAMLMEVVQQVSRPMAWNLPEDEVQALFRQQLSAVEALAHTIPAYELHISLTGAFWKEIERVLQHIPEPSSEHVFRVPRSVSPRAYLPHTARNTQHGTRNTQYASIDSLLDDGLLHVVYSGSSMNPTLSEPDLLEVAPYEGRPVRRGDVIYFEPPEGRRGDREQTPVVHRVIQVTREGGIRTRGDNNRSADPYLLRTGDIIGRVVAARRGSKRGVRRRRIAGGWRGIWVAYAGRLWRAANRRGSRLLHGAYHALAGSDLFRRLLPDRLRPRVYAFQAPLQPVLRLMMGRTVIGRYDRREGQWRIRRPFRLFVGNAALPGAAPRRTPGSPEREQTGLHVPSARLATRYGAVPEPCQPPQP